MNQKPPTRKTRKPMPPAGMVIIALFLLAVTGLTHYLVVNVLGYGDTRETHVTETQKGVDYDFASAASFYSYDARFFYFCTKDGMKYVSSNGDVRWQEMFNLTKPLLSAHSGYVAVGEEKGRRVYVFGPEGLFYSVQAPANVLTFSVNKNGYLAAVLQLEKGYAVQVYHRRYTETPLYEYVIHDPTVTPTAASVSPDGKYAVIALLDYGIRLTSKIVFCYINENDAWGTVNGVFSVVEYENNFIVPAVRFMKDNQVLVVTGSRIDCYKPNGGHFPGVEWGVPLHNKISPLAFYGESRFAFVTGEKTLNDSEAAEPGEVYIYDMNGERTGEFKFGRKATYLSMGHDHVIVGGDRHFYILNHRGGRVWDYQTLYDTRDFIFLDNTDTVLIAGNTRASVMKRTKAKTVNEDSVTSMLQ